VADDLAAALTIAARPSGGQLDEVKAAALEKVGATAGGAFEGREKEVGAAFRSLNKKLVASGSSATSRIDGRLRHPAAVRRVALIPRAHGSALFERGETRSWVSPR